ncbi:MAG: 3-oxoacid CoA-transferase subunit B [Rickettsiales bacterium]
MWDRQAICKFAAAEELKDGMFVNLGIGLPTEVANFKPSNIKVTLHSENGMLGMGPFPFKGEEDADLINAGKQTITELPESSYFNSAESFAMIRGGHIDLTILGALQVSENADLANWTIPGKMMKGMGGAMDLVAGAKRVVVLMDHNAKDGSAKLVKECVFPLTGKAVVHRVITNLGVFDFTEGGLKISKLADGVSKDEVVAKTEARVLD